MEKLTAADWVEIYYALTKKRDDVRAGVYGHEGGRQWAAHLTRILKKIGPDGENMAGA